MTPKYRKEAPCEYCVPWTDQNIRSGPVQALEAFASREPESVTLLHVIDTPAIAAMHGKHVLSTKRALRASEEAGRMLLREAERWARVALSQAVTAPRTALHTLLAHGPVARTIVRQARRLKTNLIVIASRGLSDVQGMLIGSISGEVVSVAPCSVLVIKQPMEKLVRLALAVDHSHASRAAARFLRTRLLPDSAAVTILCSAQWGITTLAARHLPESQRDALSRPALERATALVNRMRDDFIKDGYLVATKVHVHHVVDAIVQHVQAEHDDLLVIGSRALAKQERRHLGRVSESLLKYAPCSVLLVRS